MNVRELTNAQIEALLPEAFAMIRNVAQDATLDELVAMKELLASLSDELLEGDNEQE